MKKIEYIRGATRGTFYAKTRPETNRIYRTKEI